MVIISKYSYTSSGCYEWLMERTETLLYLVKSLAPANN